MVSSPDRKQDQHVPLTCTKCVSVYLMVQVSAASNAALPQMDWLSRHVLREMLVQVLAASSCWAAHTHQH
jgi:hypothetical protein